MKHFCITIFIFVFYHFANELYGQNILSGNVIDMTTAQPLQGVTIQLINNRDSNTISMTTNASGIFYKSNINPGNYTVKTNFVGYKVGKQNISFVGKPIHLFYRLEPAEIAIEEVEITAPPAVTLKGDTMEFDSRNFSTREYAEADELVAQIPGVIIDEDGKVSAHGEPVTKIIVDGKEFFSTDPRIALKSLPAEIISKIQIIEEKSEQARFSGFDDGKRNKVINIVTKPDRRSGYFGKGNAGMGASNKFGLNANINNFNADKKLAINLMANNINETNFAEQGRGGGRRGNNNIERGLSDTYAGALNYSNTFLNKAMEASADYNFRSLGTLTTTVADIELLSPVKESQFRDQDQNIDVVTTEHKLNSRIRWTISPSHRIDFSPRFTYTSTDRDVSTIFATKALNTTLLNSSTRSSENKNENINFSGSLTYMYRFKKPGRTISASISGNKSSNDALGLNLALTNYYKNNNLSSIDTNNNRSTTDGYGSGFSSRIAYTENISPRSRVQANYSFRNTTNYSNKETFEFLAETGQLGELKDLLSNEFRNDYNYNGAGMSYIYNKKDAFRLQTGINYEHGVRKNDRTIPYPIMTKADFGSYLPELTMVYNISKEKNFELNYNTATKTPSIGQLQDFINNTDRLYVHNGNPNLKQEYTHTVKAQYKDINKKTGRSLNSNFQFDYTNDKIINSLILTDRDTILFDDIKVKAGGRFATYANQDGAYSFRARNSYGLPIKKWKINLNLYTSLYYNNDYGILNDELVNNTAFGFSQTVGVNSNIKKKYVLGLNYNLNANYYQNPLARYPKYNVYIHRLNNNVSIELLKKIVINSNLSYFFNSGLMGANSINTTIWSASLGYKLFKKQNGELAIKGFDLLNNAQNVSRSVSNTAVTDITSNTLTRYFIMSLTYNLRQFGPIKSGKKKL